MRTENNLKKQIKSTSKLKIDYKQVVYMAADINYTMVYFKNGVSKMFAYTLKKFEENLAIRESFKRIHRGYLVNQLFVEAWQKRQVMLVGGYKLPISRRINYHQIKCQYQSQGLV